MVVVYRIAVGRQVGRKVFSLQTLSVTDPQEALTYTVVLSFRLIQWQFPKLFRGRFGPPCHNKPPRRKQRGITFAMPYL
jgi:hypothetical protein